MSKKLILPPDAKYSGVDIIYIKSRSTLSIGGWYDSFVGIESTEIALKEFFDKLGITEKDCRKAFTSNGGENAA